MSATQTTTKSFIETQFPVSKLSKESYKERSAGSGQTLTGLGKWWGRKPLVLVRACILGLLMPASDNPKRDREIFLKLMTMDDDGLWERYLAGGGNLKVSTVYDLLAPADRDRFFDAEDKKFRAGLSKDAKRELYRRAFSQLNYDDKLDYCCRPEEIEGPSPESWLEINEHLGTTAESLQELVEELGTRQFGHRPRVGDAFCGGGSIPFEAARIGCESFGSELNPVAGLLTWAALNIVGGGEELAKSVSQSQVEVFATLAKMVDELNVERNELGWKADAYIYCSEVVDPNTGWRVPLSPSWLIAPKYSVVAELEPQSESKSFAIHIIQDASEGQVKGAKASGTAANGVLCPVDRNGNIVPVNQRVRTRIEDLRGPNGLRRWELTDIVPRPTDVFQERLFCVKWRVPSLEHMLCAEQLLRAGSQAPGIDLNLHQVEGTVQELIKSLSPTEQNTVQRAMELDWRSGARSILAAYEGFGDIDEEDEDSIETVKELRRQLAGARKSLPKPADELSTLSRKCPRYLYREPDEADFVRENHVHTYVSKRQAEWQLKGVIPTAPIEPGAKTDEPIRTRGFTHWHHLFAPRQLLIHGLLSELAFQERDPAKRVGLVSLLGRICDWNSKLSLWLPPQSGGTGGVMNTFMNMALNTTVVFGCRGSSGIKSALLNPKGFECAPSKVVLSDARDVRTPLDIMITDPPYADAVNYEELSEFYLAWYEKHIQELFPDWYSDSRRALAVKGAGHDFKRAMVECYANFAECTNGGPQVLMFTHSSAEVWADLALIIWAAGLQVASAWCISTEKTSGLREGNYIQGTVNLVLRKRTGNLTAWRADLMPEIQAEVENQLESMLAIDDQDDPNFTDSDMQLAAYAAALSVLTRYASVEDLDVGKELARLQPQPNVVRERGKEKNPIVELIDEAVKIASDYLVPKGIERQLWRSLKPLERLYVKGLELESHGDYRNGVYIEFARGFGVRDYKVILADTKANQTRLKTATEFGSRDLRGGDFGDTLLRQVLCAVYKTAQEDDPTPGRNWLRQEVPQYWNLRQNIISLLHYLAHTPTAAMEHWSKDAAAAELLRGMVENDSV